MNPTLPRLLAALLIAVGFSSCANPDPLYLANQHRLQDIDYPASKVVGTWVYFNFDTVQTATLAYERKNYYDLASGGRGTVRQSIKNLNTGGHLSAEARLTWRYLGKNTWVISVPGSSAFRVTDSYREHLDTSRSTPPTQLVVRYLDGKLYETQFRKVLVRATYRDVAEHTARLRRSTPVIHLGPPQ